MFDIIAVGSNVVDTFVKTDPDESDLIRIKHGKLPEEELVAYPLGTKIIVKHLDFQIGGGGTNTAAAFSRLGLDTAYLGRIGKDENGLKVFNNLKEEGITFIGTLGQQNGYSTILDSVGDDRTILTYKGCNNDLQFSHLKKSKLNANGYYLCSMMGKSFTALKSIAKHAKKQNAAVAFNPSSYLSKKGTSHLKEILKNTDVLILNDEEAKDLAGYGDDKDLAERLSKEGPSTVVITKGSDGVVAYHDKKFYHAKPPKNLTIHETTGAGDAFGSTLFAAMHHGKSFPQSLKAAMINAESVIANYGAKNILLDKHALEKRLKQDKRRVTTSKKR